MTAHLFIQPLDVLFLRNNHLFGAAAGDASRALMPPWPSVFAGALRSRMLADAGATIDQFKSHTLPAPLERILGAPEAPGDFTLADVCLARGDGSTFERLRPVPADLVVTQTDDGHAIQRLEPQILPEPLATSSPARQLPILRTDTPAKPVSGLWLTAAGWQAHLCGQPLDAARHLVPAEELWQTDTRLGIALDADKRAAAHSQIYTSDAVAMQRETGFAVTVRGADDCLPTSGLLRLGGDGRGARVQTLEAPPTAEPDWDRIRTTGRFRMILTSPGLFARGHLPSGADGDSGWQLGGASARLISHAVPRHEVISGWDMHKHRPKPAQRCAPTGSVYWFDGFDGDIDGLRKLSDTGLWDTDHDNDHASRRAEGFNRVTIANA